MPFGKFALVTTKVRNALTEVNRIIVHQENASLIGDITSPFMTLICYRNSYDETISDFFWLRFQTTHQTDTTGGYVQLTIITCAACLTNKIVYHSDSFTWQR